MFATSNAAFVYVCEKVVCMCVCMRMCMGGACMCACTCVSFSNYLLQPSDNNGGLIKAKPGGVCTHWCAAGNFLPARGPLTGQE